MSFFCDDVDTALGGYHTSAYTGLGLPGADVPAGGTDGASVLYPCLTLPADAAVEVFAQLTRLPTLGTLTFEEDGSLIYAGSTDYLEFRLWVDGIASTTNIGYGAGVVRVSLAVGGASAFTGGAVLGRVVAGGLLELSPPLPFAAGVPRLAFRQRTGELFPLLLDSDNVPYAYQRPGGGTVALRPLDSVSLGVAVAEGTGEMLIII